FRQDLFYRLNVVTLSLPPLRQREGDITLLANHFVSRLNEAGTKQVDGLVKATLDVLERYHWPGNVRELQNAVESAHSLCPGPLIVPDDLPARILSVPGLRSPAPVDDFEAARRQFEGQYMEGLLRRCDGNVTRAAEASGIHRSTLQRLMRRIGLRSEDFRT
ncbi:MAG: sigma-54-dependent Fis family transcriptional regulator, partial [bacterium]|nr:sigma-54-dependent Fis family transcriptional regulator [bacterium]